MAVTYSGQSAMAGGDPVSSITVTLPTVSAGDVIFVCSLYRNGSQLTFTDPSGYTKIGDEFDASDTIGGGLWYKVAGGSESNPAVGLSSSVPAMAVCAVYSGADTSTPIDGTPISEKVATGVTAQGTAYTTSNNNSMVVHFVTHENDSTFTLSPDNSFTLRNDGNGTTVGNDWGMIWGTDGAIALADKVQATAGSVTMPVWQGMLSGDKPFFSVALNEAGAGGGATNAAKRIIIT